MVLYVGEVCYRQVRYGVGWLGISSGGNMAKLIVCKECGKLRKHKGHGLCGVCYLRYWYKHNPDYLKKRYNDNPEGSKARCRKWELSKFGLTVEDYDEMLEAQGGGCAICGRTVAEEGRRLSVDHCHESGMVRGLLCNRCNRGLGLFQDSVHNLSEAISYLTEAR